VATLLITDYRAQQQKWQEITPDAPHFIGLYGDAVMLLSQNSDLLAHQTLSELSHFSELYCCPSAAKRRGIEALPNGVRWLSLPMMLERIASPTLHVQLHQNNSVARTDALELCLAALALDWTVQLSASANAIAGLARASPQAGAKGFASLPMFGLSHVFIDAEQANSLAADALMLPWQIGVASSANLIAAF
jgi:hypothetical protein